MLMIGVAASAAAVGGCARHSQPLAPPDAHQWSVPTPAGVVYHADEDRWEVVLAPPTPGVNEWPEYVPGTTRSGGMAFDGFRPNPETYEQNPRALIGEFPRLMSFKEDRWTIVLVPGTVSKKYQQEGGYLSRTPKRCRRTHLLLLVCY